jgi:hypothetical protein
MKIDKEHWKYVGIVFLIIVCIIGYQQYTEKPWVEVMKDLWWLKEILIVHGPIVMVG